MSPKAKIIKMVPREKVQVLPAGRFSSWLRSTRSALAAGRGVDVPCGTCRACCQSSYFIHILPGETGTLARIPRKFLVAAPGLPKGNLLMGHFENGFCPMLRENECSIYACRPGTCRYYDCRIFKATGLAAQSGLHSLIARRVKQWKFECPAPQDRELWQAVRTAARFIHKKLRAFPAGSAPRNLTQAAVLAVKSYPCFLKSGSSSQRRISDRERIGAILREAEKFERRCRSKGRAV